MDSDTKPTNVIPLNGKGSFAQAGPRTTPEKIIPTSESENVSDRTREISHWEHASKKALHLPRKRILDINAQFESLGLAVYEPFTPEEEIMLSLWGYGYTMDQVCRYMNAAHGLNVRNQDIIKTSDKLLPLIQMWRQRPLQRVYPILYLDAKYFDVKSNGRNVGMTAYSVLGVSPEGRKSFCSFPSSPAPSS